MTTAAVLNEVNTPLEIRDDIEVESPHAGEVRVRVAAAGVCHTDLSMQDGTITPNLPMVLGHEAAGVVEEIGDEVTTLEPGDHVVISAIAQCGTCFFCTKGQPFLCATADLPVIAGSLLDGTTRLSSRGAPLMQMSGCGTFAQEMIIPEINAVRIDKDIDLTMAALIGCGVLTGVGAVTNTAQVQPGESVAVLGCGGVGLNVIQGARIAGAAEIIAIARHPRKLEMTKEFGATATINATEEDPVAAVQKMTEGRGVDVAFEVVGLPDTVQQSIGMTRRGGRTILVGGTSFDATVEIAPAGTMVFGNREIRGCWYGSADVQRDVPRLVELHRAGQLKLQELISARVGLEDVNDAFEAIKSGDIARSVIVF